MCGGPGCGGSRGKGLLKRDCGLYPGPGVDPRGVCSGPPYGSPNVNYYPCGFAGRSNPCRVKEPWDIRQLNFVWNYNRAVAYCCHPPPCTQVANPSVTLPETVADGNGQENKNEKDGKGKDCREDDVQAPTEDEISKCFDRIRKFIMTKAKGENDSTKMSVRDLDKLKSNVLGSGGA